ncbi:MAG: ABC transporter permease subunit [Actinomycetes bacterium]
MKFSAIARKSFWALLSLYFILPMLALARFSMQTTPTFLLNWSNVWENWSLEYAKKALTDPGVIKASIISLELTALTILVTFAVLIPLAVYIEVSMPQLKPFMTAATVIPWLIPPVALVVGVAATFRVYLPQFLNSPLSLTFFYALWMFPFTYRAIDGQLRLIDVRNLYEAAQSIGCGAMKFFWVIVIPNLRTSLFVSVVLIVASVLGEYAFAALLLKQTLPVYMFSFSTEDVRAGFALALIVMVVTALLLGWAVSTLRKRGLHFSATGI